MAVFDDKWLKTSATIAERGFIMFNNDQLSDVSLVVRSGDEAKKSKMAIPAHKFVLSICSPVFFAMFCGKMAEKSNAVELPDCEYEAVLEMLRFMYSEKVELNESNVMQVMYVAKKYMLKSLVDECIDFLDEHLNVGNVLWVLSHALQYDETDLVAYCWEDIDRDTYGVVKSAEFASIERRVLEEIVTRDSLTISEIELFKAVNLWAAEKCKRDGLSVNGNEKRRVLGENVVHAIRFPTMEEKEFASVVINSEILTSEEVVGVMKYFNSGTSTTGFPEKERNGALLSCCRVSVLDSTKLVYFNNFKRYCIDFCVDEDIELHGIRMIGSENGDYVAMVNVTSDQEVSYQMTSASRVFSSVSMRMHSKSFVYYGFNVLFSCPADLKKNVRYRVTAIIDGPASPYGLSFETSITSHGVKFHFIGDEDSYDSDDSQFAELLFQRARLH